MCGRSLFQNVCLLVDLAIMELQGLASQCKGKIVSRSGIEIFSNNTL